MREIIAAFKTVVDACVSILLLTLVTAFLMFIGWNLAAAQGAPVRHYPFLMWWGVAIFLRALFNAGIKMAAERR